MPEIPEFTVYDPPSETVYVPFVSDDGRVGYRIIDTREGCGDREVFLYFNPSVSEGRGDANVFVYIGGENDPEHDEALHFYTPWNSRRHKIRPERGTTQIPPSAIEEREIEEREVEEGGAMRKGSKMVFCDRHAPWFAGETRRRQLECMVEGGPGGMTPGCEGGKCRLWPGTDVFMESICHGELFLPWTATPAKEESA